MKIAIGSDHAGYPYKEKIKPFLEDNGNTVVDFGTDSDESVDYPRFIRPVAEAVAAKEADRGIVLGGSGNGEAMVANRVKGIRCALCWNTESARLAREHNDANVLSLGARMMPIEEALDIVKVWLETPFEGGRHIKRIKDIDRPVPAGPRTVEEREKPRDTEKYDLLIAFRFIKYMEGDNFMEFQVDPGLKEPSVVHIPSPERWASEAPSWAQDRREEILERIKSKCVHMACEWRDY